jgi:Zn-dependent metalloprotease
MKFVCNIVPPDLLNQLLKDAPEEHKDIVLKTLMMDSKMRERRSILGSMYGLLAKAAEKSICIFDAHNTQFESMSTKARCIGDSESTDNVINETFDGFGHTYNFYDKVFGRKSIDDKNFPLNAFVHWGVRFMNAFFDGRKMAFGDGDPQLGIKGFTESIDVIAHELTHGVTQYEAELEYFCDETHQPGAVNESISDVFGSLVKQHALNQSADKADWLIGQIFTDPGKALRSMKAPGTARPNDRQPAHIKDYVNLPNDDIPANDHGGVHINSGIPNKAFYTAAIEIGGFAWEKAGRIWYKTLGSGLHIDCSFQEFAEHTEEASRALYGDGSTEHKAVKKGWNTVGIKT